MGRHAACRRAGVSLEDISAAYAARAQPVRVADHASAA